MLNTYKNWQQENYTGLLAEINQIKQLLRNQLSSQEKNSRVATAKPTVDQHRIEQPKLVVSDTVTYVAESYPNNSVSNTDDHLKSTSVMLDNLCHFFGLSSFERQIMLLSVAV